MTDPAPAAIAAALVLTAIVALMVVFTVLLKPELSAQALYLGKGEPEPFLVRRRRRSPLERR